MGEVPECRVVVLLALAFSACAPPAEEPAFRNLQAEYVGDAVCFDCHEDQWRGFQEHGMAHSFFRLTRQNSVEDWEAAPLWHEQSGFYYRVYARDSAYFQEEYRLDPRGEKAHRLIRQIAYVVGSGFAARTYLTQSGGRLYEMPLTWYTQTGMWDFSPGYEAANKRFGRLVPDRCMACHNSIPVAVPFVQGKYAAVPAGIGCERCHGPGSLHVDERLESPAPASGADRSIVNPARLSQQRQLDVCEQCHLSATVSLLRQGRDPYGYRPSEPLEEHIALFAETSDGAAVGVISHAERLRKSACFRDAAMPMTCTTCHDPHAGFRDKGPAYFDNTCSSCHETAAAHAAAESCIGCHMPRVRVDDAPHSSFTDHWIRVVPTLLPEPMAAHASPDLVAHFARDAAGAEAKRYEALAYIVLGTQRADTSMQDRGVRELAEALDHAPDATGASLFLLGLTHLRRRRGAEALEPLARSVELGPDIPERLNALAQAYEQVGQRLDEARRLYTHALAVEPALADIRVNYGRFLETQGELSEAARQYALAADEKPWLAEAHYNLGTAHLLDGQFADAEAALRQALELEPDYVAALGNLGLLHVSRNDPEAARQLFERAVAAAPGSATALSNLGTFYLEATDLARAIAYLGRAVEADPAFVESIAKLALAYYRNEDYAMARRYAERALELDPGSEAARLILEAR